ncbi:trypsin-like peptidase domain-containing protein [Streptomyces sp. NPDC004232]|uniref:trypsin-like peptidase domain-containing protein n=1 Tax=Streptomyces sp. NPDC004232 TaxID=3154454 RepID=UPI0033A13FF1
MGTAFLLSTDGLVATAAHVLAGGPSARWAFEPLTAGGQSYPVRAVHVSDPGPDVALLSIDPVEGGDALPLVAHSAAAPGDQVHLRGFAEARAFDSGVGAYVGEVSEGGRIWVKVSCRHAQPGMSGAPVILTGTGCVIGLVSARLNAARWNRDTVLLARTEDLVALAPDRLRLVVPGRRSTTGTLRLSWLKEERAEPVLETDDFHVSLGRSSVNRVQLPDSRDSRFHGHLSLLGTALVYQHLGAQPAFLLGPARQVTVNQGSSVPVSDKDRLRVGSGTLLIEFSSPDLFDPNAKSTADPDA